MKFDMRVIIAKDFDTKAFLRDVEDVGAFALLAFIAAFWAPLVALRTRLLVSAALLTAMSAQYALMNWNRYGPPALRKGKHRVQGGLHRADGHSRMNYWPTAVPAWMLNNWRGVAFDSAWHVK